MPVMSTRNAMCFCIICLMRQTVSKKAVISWFPLWNMDCHQADLTAPVTVFKRLEEPISVSYVGSYIQNDLIVLKMTK